MKNWLLGICLLILGLPSLSYSQANTSWSLEQCIAKAMEESFGVEMAKLNVENASLSLLSAERAKYPNLNANINLGSNFGRTIDPTTNDFINTNFVTNNYGLSTGVILYNAGRINNTIKQAEASLAQANANTESVKYDIALQVSNQYMNVLFAEENLKNQFTQEALIQSQLENLDRLINAGVRPTNDRLELEAQLAQSEQATLQVENQLALAKLGLLQLMRVDGTNLTIETQRDLGAILDPDNLTLEELVERTIAHHPGLRAAEFGLEQAKIGEDVARSALYPTISAGGNLGTAYSNSGIEIDGYTTEAIQQTVLINDIPTTFEIEQEVPIIIDSPYGNQISNNLSYGLGLGVNIPIFNNGRAKIGIQQAELNTRNQQLALEQTKETIRMDLQNVLLDARGAKKRFEGSQIALESQSAAFEINDKKYKAGSIGNLEWITAQNLLNQAQVNASIAKYEYFFKVKVLEFYLNGLNAL